MDIQFLQNSFFNSENALNPFKSWESIQNAVERLEIQKCLKFTEEMFQNINLNSEDLNLNKIIEIQGANLFEISFKTNQSLHEMEPAEPKNLNETPVEFSPGTPLEAFPNVIEEVQPCEIITDIPQLLFQQAGETYESNIFSPVGAGNESEESDSIYPGDEEFPPQIDEAQERESIQTLTVHNTQEIFQTFTEKSMNRNSEEIPSIEIQGPKPFATTQTEDECEMYKQICCIQSHDSSFQTTKEQLQQSSFTYLNNLPKRERDKYMKKCQNIKYSRIQINQQSRRI